MVESYEVKKSVSPVYDLFGGKADGEDVIGEGDRFLHVQESNVSVQILFPVILRMDDDLIDRDNLLCTSLIPNITEKIKRGITK